MLSPSASASAPVSPAQAPAIPTAPPCARGAARIGHKGGVRTFAVMRPGHTRLRSAASDRFARVLPSFFVRKGTERPNRFAPDPLAGTRARNTQPGACGRSRLKDPFSRAPCSDVNITCWAKDQQERKAVQVTSKTVQRMGRLSDRPPRPAPCRERGSALSSDMPRNGPACAPRPGRPPRDHSAASCRCESHAAHRDRYRLHRSCHWPQGRPRRQASPR